MANKIEILGQLMFHLKDEQNQVMNDINALLNKRNVQENLINILNDRIGSLAHVHAKMQETEAFILQLTSLEIENNSNSKEDKN